jgi:hypothetical protein
MPITTRRWIRGPLLGALLGFPLLGGGGRLAMHAIALTTPGAQRAVSVEGTITVLLAGLAAGLAGGAIYALLDRFLPGRRLARALVFALVLVLLTLRGLRPVQPLALALFLPLVLLYGALVERAWHARSRDSHIVTAST